MSRTHRPAQLCTVPDCDRETGDQTYVCPECGDRLLRLLRLMPDHVGDRARVLCHPHLPHHNPCTDCGRGIAGHPRPNPYRLTGDAKTSPGLATDLDVAIARESTGKAVLPADTAHGLAEETSTVRLPYGYTASEARWGLLNTLVRWGDDIAHRRGLFRPFDTLTALARWHTDQILWLRQQPDGGEAIGDMTAALRNALRAVDRPADLKYAGPCTGSTITDDGLEQPCTGELYARPGAEQIECRECGASYDVESRRSWLREQAEDRLLPATELARAIDGLGVPVTPSMIRGWKARGRLLNRGTQDRPLYRVGDVIDLVTARQTARTA